MSHGHSLFVWEETFIKLVRALGSGEMVVSVKTPSSPIPLHRQCVVRRGWREAGGDRGGCNAIFEGVRKRVPPRSLDVSGK